MAAGPVTPPYGRRWPAWPPSRRLRRSGRSASRSPGTAWATSPRPGQPRTRG